MDSISLQQICLTNTMNTKSFDVYKAVLIYSGVTALFGAGIAFFKLRRPYERHPSVFDRLRFALSGAILGVVVPPFSLLSSIALKIAGLSDLHTVDDEPSEILFSSDDLQLVKED